MMITIQEYADKKGITRSAVYAAIKRGTLKVKEVNSGRERYLIDENAKYCSRVNHYDKKYRGISKHPLYSVWRDMKSRCFNPNAQEYYNYGGRGITVCDEWRNDALSFIQWGLANGYEKGLEIDRINNNGNYSHQIADL